MAVIVVRRPDAVDIVVAVSVIVVRSPETVAVLVIVVSSPGAVDVMTTSTSLIRVLVARLVSTTVVNCPAAVSVMVTIVPESIDRLSDTDTEVCDGQQFEKLCREVKLTSVRVVRGPATSESEVAVVTDVIVTDTSDMLNDSETEIDVSVKVVGWMLVIVVKGPETSESETETIVVGTSDSEINVVVSTSVIGTSEMLIDSEIDVDVTVSVIEEIRMDVSTRVEVSVA